MKKNILIAVCLLILTFSGTAQIISTIAGIGTASYSGDGGPATAAELNFPTGIAVDGAGNYYIADSKNHRIRKVSSLGVISTIAGNGTMGFSGDGGQSTAAKLNEPGDITVDASGNVYVADMGNDRIRKINTSGVISTVAGGGFGLDGSPATTASLNRPSDVVIDAMGNIYIADLSHSRVRKVSASTGIITTTAGTGTFGYSGDGGPASVAELMHPNSVLLDGSGNLYISDGSNDRIRKVDASGIITTVIGTGAGGFSGDGGQATAAKINSPGGLAIDGAGNVYVADGFNNRIRMVNTSGIITTVAGNGSAGYGGDGGSAIAAMLAFPPDVTVDASGKIYIADMTNHRIRIITGSVSVNALVDLETGIRVYPNPMQDDITILIATNTDEEVHVVITNSVGTIMKEFTAVTNKDIPLSMQIPKGMYFIHAATQIESWSETFVK